MMMLPLIAFCVMVLLAVGVGVYWPQGHPAVTVSPPPAQADDNGGEC